MSQVNRATSQTLRIQATQEGLVPLKAWVKSALDRVVQGCFGATDLEFAWVGDDAVDPLAQAQTIAILVGAGVKTVAEAGAELGLGQSAGVVKYNPYHDERGRFTDAEGAVVPGTASKPEDPAKPAAREDAKPNEVRAFYAAPLASRAYHAAVQAAHEVVSAAEDAGASAAGGLVRGIVTSAAATAALASAALLAMTSSTGGVQQSAAPDRPDMTYRWAQDESTATFSVQSDGQTQTLRVQQNAAGDFVDSQGNVVATVEIGLDGQRSLLVDPDAVDAAIAALSSPSGTTTSGNGSPNGLQTLYVNPETGDVTYGPADAPPPGYKPVSGAQADQVGTPNAGQQGQSAQSTPTLRAPLLNADKANIQPSKIFGYSLNPDNPDGKAAVFESALGFNQANASRLIEAIRNGVTSNLASFYSFDHGAQYRIDMQIGGPNGNTRTVRTGWIYDLGSDTPRLTTAFVLKE